MGHHLALVTTSYPTTHDGSEAAGSFVADFAQVLAQQIAVTVIAPSVQPMATEHHQHLTVERFLVPQLPLVSLSSPRAIAKTLKAGLTALEQVVQQQSIDHILALWVLPAGYWAHRISQRYHIPYSTWALGSDIWRLGKIPGVKQVLIQVLKNSHCNFADGYLLQQAVEALSKRRGDFLPSTRQLSLTTSKMLADKPPYRLAFLGRWHHNKGVDLLLESLSLLIHWQNIGAVRIAGGGPLEKTVNAAYSTLKAQNRPVQLLGYLDKSAALNLLQWADYVCIPSRIESIPLIFSDAMKCQCPLIATPVGDLPRLMQQYRVGTLATEVSSFAFAQAIQRALTQAPVTFAPGLSQAADAFNLEHIAQHLLTILYE